MPALYHKMKDAAPFGAAGMWAELTLLGLEDDEHDGHDAHITVEKEENGNFEFFQNIPLEMM